MLKQDMFLVGGPGPYRRTLAMMFCVRDIYFSQQAPMDLSYYFSSEFDPKRSGICIALKGYN